MFDFGHIYAYPTNTSFGLGVRADDAETLQKLKELKQRPDEKFFSLMVKDIEMLHNFAYVPPKISADFFIETPRTAILKPKPTLPTSIFWPSQKVAFRVCTLPEIAKHIEFPITATSANISSKEPIFTIEKLKEVFQEKISIISTKEELPYQKPSEIWDFTETVPKRIR